MIIAKILGRLLMPIGFIYGVFRTDPKDYFFLIALSLDQLGNVVMAELFNDILIKKNRDLFGNPDETISSVLGKNQLNGTLKPLGKLLVNILNKIEKDHCIKSIELKK